MEAVDLAIVALAALALLLALALGLIVWRASPGRAINRRLALLLAAEGAMGAMLLVDRLVFGAGGVRSWDAVGSFVMGCVVAAYLAFLARLESPLARPLRAMGLAPLPLIPVAFGLAAYLTWTPPEDESVAGAVAGAIVAACIVLVFVGGLVVALSTWRRAPAASMRRAQAGAFALAFGARDALWLALILATVLVESAGREFPSAVFMLATPAITLVFVPILAYGLLKTQLFDIDLRIKLGLQRSTVVTLVAVTSIVVGKLVDHYAQATWGWIAGIGVAIVMLFFSRLLDKVGQKVAQAALPRVEPTSRYLEFRKMEVYKAAVETALEDGQVTPEERRLLEGLRAKMGISPEDAQAMEADLRAQPRAGGAVEGPTGA